MKAIYTLPLMLGSLSVSGQVVHPAGAAITTVNWSPLVNPGPSYYLPDSLALDLDGDNLKDVTVISHNYATTFYLGDSPGVKYIFGVVIRQSNVQIANDSVQTSWAHRFQAGEVIKKGLV